MFIKGFPLAGAILVAALGAWTLTAGCRPLPAQVQANAERNENPIAARLNAYLSQLERAGFQGSVLVAADDEILAAQSMGLQDVAMQIRNTRRTIFDIGSLTKQFTGAAITKLADEGRIGFDDSASKYIESLSADKKAITIHHLLRHRSGLVSTVGGDFDPVTRDGFIGLVNSSKLRSRPGERFSYSNVGYSLLGMIIERVSGMTYEAYIRAHLLEAAGMTDTGYTLPAEAQNRIATGYQAGSVWGRPTEKPWDGSAPYWHLRANGGLLSTVDDLYKWRAALASGRILTATSYARYLAPPLQPDESRGSYYAYGWDVHETSRKTRMVAHNGFNRVFYADVSWFPDDDVLVVSLSNAANESFMRINRHLSNLVFVAGYEPPAPLADTPGNRQFTERLVRVVTESGVDAGVRHLAATAENGALESVVTGAALRELKAGNSDGAIALLNFNVRVHPRSSLAFEALAEVQMQLGQPQAARVNLERSLQLDPENGYARSLLNRLIAEHR